MEVSWSLMELALTQLVEEMYFLHSDVYIYDFNISFMKIQDWF